MDTELQCSICLKEFDKTKNLMRHLKLHSNIKSYKCTFQDCSMAYSRSDHLKRHLISHSSNPKPFKCDSCILRFSNKSHLNRHIKLHNLPKEHIKKGRKERKADDNIKDKSSNANCFFPYCNFKSSNQRRLIHHINHKHNRTKILSSKVCFSNKRNSLNERYKHLISSNKLNNQMFKCEINNCGKIYSSKYNLSIHVKSYHLNNGFQCEYLNCEMMFKHKCSLKKHILNVHCKVINSNADECFNYSNNDDKKMKENIFENQLPINDDQTTNYKTALDQTYQEKLFDDKISNTDSINFFFDNFNFSFIENRCLLEQLDN